MREEKGGKKQQQKVVEKPISESVEEALKGEQCGIIKTKYEGVAN